MRLTKYAERDIELRSAADDITLIRLRPCDIGPHTEVLKSGEGCCGNLTDSEPAGRHIENRHKGRYMFGVWDKAEMVGGVALRDVESIFETSSVVHEDRRGNNYVCRARNILLNFGFAVLGVKRVRSRVRQENEASKISVERSGFEFGGDMGGFTHYWVYPEARATDKGKLLTIVFKQQTYEGVCRQ